MECTRYPKGMKDRAKLEGKFLLTVAVDGNHLKDGSCSAQLLVDLPTAQKYADIVVELMYPKFAS